MNIRDIADIAGVGVSTVSRVINNHPDVKVSTREKVLKIIEEYNYIPNNSARVLKKANTNYIGLLVKGIYNPFFSEMINIIGSIIASAGYSMLYEQGDYKIYQDVDNIISFSNEKKLQGVIYLGGNFIDLTDESFSSLNIPVVLTSVNTVSKLGKKTYSSVGIDNVKAAYEATSYLIELGHKNIAIILGKDDDMGATWWRFNGYKKALAEHNINLKEEYILVGEYESEKPYEVTKKLLQEDNDVTAIFALSDIMAVGCARAVVDSNLKLGKDISLVGFDGLDYSEFYTPAITTVKQPRKLMAETSAKLLLSLIKNETENEHILLDTKLIKRESCNKIL